MTKPKGKQPHVKLKPFSKIKPLPEGHRLAPPSVPVLQLGKFTHIEGQMVLDFSEDEEPT